MTNTNSFLKLMAGAVLTLTLAAGAQAPAPAPTPAPAPAPAAAPAADAPAAPAAPTWSVGLVDFSGFVDGYYSYNANRPSNAANGQVNDLYNFNDKTDQFSLAAAKFSMNHDPDPVGAHVDLLYGRTNTLINGSGEGNYIEQAFLSFKPAKAKGLELDFGKFVTSAGAEVIESKDNWNYSRGLLFVNAIPYFHFGLRSSMPVSKTLTLGLQLVNGWNNVTKSNGGVTVGITSAYVKPKFTWNTNIYTGPENTGTQKGYRNLIDTTVLTTLPGKINFLVNYDWGQQRDAVAAQGDSQSKHWQGIAFGVKDQATAKAAVAVRYEYFNDPQGSQTGAHQYLNEVTGTYEYKWVEGLLARLEVRRDWSDEPFFHKGNSPDYSIHPSGYVVGGVKAQTTVTAGFVAFFGPKR